MARLYADEQFPLSAVEYLRALNHDVLTVQEAGQAGLKIPDHEVLAFASSVERAVITLNRKDFKRLHRLFPDHAGLTLCELKLRRFSLRWVRLDRINNVYTIPEHIALHEHFSRMSYGTYTS